jgi:hypothetical protein
MRSHPPILTALCGAALALGACGSAGGGGGAAAPGPNPNDKRGVALGCIEREKGLDARLVGEKSIQVGGPGGPRIEFFVSAGEAEGKQFQGEAQGAEQVGAALLYVNDAGDEVLEKVEDCLNEQ